jgi:ribosomal protein S18 acetylase RimI-like enzyme
LDDLANPEGVYNLKNGGAFFVAKHNGKIIATIGIKPLSTKPELVEKFTKRGYKDDNNIASIWRAYVDKNYRSMGIGKKLVTLGEDFFAKQGYKIIYLHTSKHNPCAVVFWQKRGYKIILEEDSEDQTVHMEKKLID